jgi:hypothetical protein
MFRKKTGRLASDKVRLIGRLVPPGFLVIDPQLMHVIEIALT